MDMLDAAATAAALPYARLVPALARAAAELSRGAIAAPERKVVPIDAHSVLLCMPALAPDIGVTKLITVHGANARRGLPAIQGEVIVFDTATGRRLALLDGPTVTARRTAAMTLLGMQVLAPRRPASAWLIGTGAQAAALAEALATQGGIGELDVTGPSAARAAGFAARLRERHPGVAVQVHADPAAAPETDVVVALTTSAVPVVPERLAAHTLAIGVGAFKPNMAELPPALLHARAIVVDDVEGARHEAGDLIQAGIDWGGVRALGDILAGKAAVPPGQPGCAPVFKTVGQAAWDLAAARVAAGG